MISSGRTPDRKQPEKFKYLEWLEKEKKKGLLDIKLVINESMNDINSEQIYAELNKIQEAIDNGNCEIITKCNAKGEKIF